MLAENLFGFPNWCGFWKWVLWTRLQLSFKALQRKVRFVHLIHETAESLQFSVVGYLN
jgi:hypothetical protein